MKTIKIDEKEYVLKEDADKKIEELTENKVNKLNTIYTVGLMDETTIMGMGSVEIGDDYQVVRLTLEYLERMINAVKAMSCTKNKIEFLDIAVSTDKPCVFGQRDILNKSIGGFILAPRVQIN